MKNKIVKIILMLSIISIITLPTFAVQRTNDVIQTIPPIITSSQGAISGCTILSEFPGSAIIGTSGFIKATCPNNVPAIILSGIETPNFILATGFTQISLMWYASACSFKFLPANTTRLFGMNLTSSNPITFTPDSNSTTQLLQGGYNYCLYYQNPPINGILSFTISWTP